MPSSQHALARCAGTLTTPIRVLLAGLLAAGLLSLTATAASAAGGHCIGVSRLWKIYGGDVTAIEVAWTEGHEHICTNGKSILSSGAQSDGDTTGPGEGTGWQIHVGAPYHVSTRPGRFGTYGHATWRYDGTVRECLWKFPVCSLTSNFHVRLTVTMFPWWHKKPRHGWWFMGRWWKATFVIWCPDGGVTFSSATRIEVIA